MILQDDELTKINNSIYTSSVENVKQRFRLSSQEDYENKDMQTKIDEAKWAKDVLIERQHELQEEKDLLEVVKTRPGGPKFEEIKEEDESIDSLHTDTQFDIEQSSMCEESKQSNMTIGSAFVGSPRDSQPSANKTGFKKS